MVGIGLAALAGRLIARPTSPTPVRRLDRGDLAALVLLLGLSAAVRFPGLGQAPPGGYFDEAKNALVARGIVEGARPVFVADATQLPALPFYPLAAAVALRGSSVESVRMVSAVVGTLTVLVLYLLARRLLPRPAALTVAFLAVGMRWHLNFSRVGFIGIWVPLLSTVAILLLVRALAGSRRGPWIGLGAVAGAGVQTYYAFNAVPVVLLAFLASARLRGGPSAGFDRRRDRRRLLQGVLLAAATALVVLLPLLVFAVRNPDAFLERYGSVAIWNPAHQLDVPSALASNARAHLLMFGYRGDGNPRHNILDAPLLTSVESILLMLGIGVAVGRGLAFPGAPLLVWLAALLLPGVLTIEAPQAYRTIGAIPAVLLLCGEAVAFLGRLAAGASGRSRPRLLELAFPALGIALAAWNASDYFHVQATDPRAWIAFDADAGALARFLADEGTGRDLYVDSVLVHPIISVVTRGPAGLPILRVSDHFPSPASPPPRRPALFLLKGVHGDLVPRFREAWPCATAKPHLDPSGRPMFWSVLVPAECRDLPPSLRGSGFLAVFRPGAGFAASPTLVRVDPAVLFHFHTSEDALPHPFGADWVTYLDVAPGGVYAFELYASGPACLLVDGSPVLSASGGGSPDPVRAELELSAGEHVLALRYLEDSYEARVRLLWTPPGGRRSTMPLARLRAPSLAEYERLRPQLPELRR